MSILPKRTCHFKGDISLDVEPSLKKQLVTLWACIFLVEFNGCCPDILNDVAIIGVRAIVDAAQKAGATVIQSSSSFFHRWRIGSASFSGAATLAIHILAGISSMRPLILFTCGGIGRSLGVV